MTTIMGHLQLILLMSYVTNTLLAALLAWSGRTFRGGWLWVLGQALLTLGTVGDALPPEVPPWIPLVLGNASYIAASVALSHSIWVFRFDAPFPRWIYLAIPAELLTFLWAYGHPYLVRSLIFSAWMSVGPLVNAALLLWRLEPGFRVSNGLTALPFLALGLASVIRSGLLIGLLVQGTDLPVGELNVWYVGGAILLSTIMLFGYFLMTGIRYERSLQRQDAEIADRNRQLLDAARSKDLFFAVVAHDLRGPIGGAARYARKHLVGKMAAGDRFFSELTTLTLTLEKTNEFLDKLLWWSRAQFQDWVPQHQPLAARELIEAAVAAVLPAAEAKQLRFDIPPTPLPQPVGDAESVRLILSNLASNAVKFSNPGGQVRFRVRAEGLRCAITVEDDGVGIGPEVLARLFRMEAKLTTAGTADEPGNGLGLILAQSLAEKNRGSVTVDSQPGRGTQATLWLPLVERAVRERPQAPG